MLLAVVRVYQQGRELRGDRSGTTAQAELNTKVALEDFFWETDTK
jgi:hypothetical protein